MIVSQVSVITPDLEALWDHAYHDVVAKRGGVALLRTLCGTTGEREFLNEVVLSKSLSAVHVDGQLIADR